MPKNPAPIRLNLNLLKPQGLPEKFVVRLIRWLLSTGRFLIVLVEAIVLIAFVTRFKYDSDLETLKDAINEKVQIVRAFKSDEALIRQTQFQLATIKADYQTSPDYVDILKKISTQTPFNVRVIQLVLEKNNTTANFKIAGSSLDNNQLNSFLLGLKAEPTFSEVNLVGVGVEKELITFTISGVAKK